MGLYYVVKKNATTPLKNIVNVFQIHNSDKIIVRNTYMCALTQKVKKKKKVIIVLLHQDRNIIQHFFF